MITFLPDPEIQKAEAERKRLQPKNKFQFLWDAFFRNRKFKLSPEDVRELEQAEETARPWNEASRMLWDIVRDPDENLWRAIGRLKENPNPETVRDFLLARHVSPVFQNQTHKALDELRGTIEDKIRTNVVPLVRRHLERIHDSLVMEYREQEKSDAKSLARLEGLVTGGESQACIELRIRAEGIQNLLESGDLTAWREVLGPFLA